MVVLFAASQVLFHTLPCSESHGIPGGTEGRYTITYKVQREEGCEDAHHSARSVAGTQYTHSFVHYTCYPCSHWMNEHVWLRGRT